MLAPRSKSTSLGHSNPGSAKFRLSGILQCEILKCCDGTLRVIVGTTRQEILQEKSLKFEEIVNSHFFVKFDFVWLIPIIESLVEFRGIFNLLQKPSVIRFDCAPLSNNALHVCRPPA
nr:unnamed protein product [Callosobruchus chinensis]